MRTFMKKVRYAIDAGKKEEAEKAFKAAIPVLDKMAGKGRVSKNAAARYKSRLNAQIRAL
jgi:small subunit ribosomal protein S20